MPTVEDHFGRFEGAQRGALERTWQVICRALPGGSPAISYGMPTMKVGTTAVIAIDGFTRHNSLFPYSGGIPTQFEEELAGYERTKGSIHFPVDRPFPATLLKEILGARIAEINAGYPKKSGESLVYYGNGFLKAAGKVKGGNLHGPWSWYRSDGTLMRTGSFDCGVQVGQWTTYDRSGAVVRVTNIAKQ
jgi:uncharacterized protein YdhG (YjbR/CyaY superfamily)